MPAPRLLKRIAIAASVAIGLVLLAGAVAAAWLRAEVRASLPLLDGRVEVAGLSNPITVERDALGVPTIRAASREDVALALGFLHAQDRFFQMDLQRRLAAGELAALVGGAALDHDRQMRRHRFRALAARKLGSTPPERLRVLESYAAGVNAGLAALGAAPPEYLLLRESPEPWRPEDCFLTLLSMFVQLQGDDGARESRTGLIAELLPPELVRFLLPPGGDWDAPLVGEPFATPPVPSPSTIDLHASSEVERAEPVAADRTPEPVLLPGSNNWALDGKRTAHGGALLANDMHLGLGLPNIWYRTSMRWIGPSGEEARLDGVTLPGAPALIVGSNGHVAWGFSNSQGDWSDLVVLESGEGDGSAYLTPEGPRELERFEERIEVHGAEAETIEVAWTIWGPLIDEDHRARRRALRWTAHDDAAVNMDLLALEEARSVDDVMRIAPLFGIPAQNVVVADRDGRIGWTIAGRIPRRRGFAGTTPASWAEGSRGWDGWVEAESYPRVVDPPSGQLWTANNRTVDGAWLSILGDGGYALGARARQIRDALSTNGAATEQQMLALQLDDRALFLERWRELLLRTLDDEAIEASPKRLEARRLVEETWTGRASIDSVGYRIVRAFRFEVADRVFEPLTEVCRAADPGFRYSGLAQWEGPLWELLAERPRHLLSPAYPTWDDLLLSALDATLAELAPSGPEELGRRSWGDRNTVRISHPLSRAVPQLARWLDLPPEPLPGDAYMPRVQSVTFGASERLVVSPGREEEGILHMPGGQGGHPLSPFYREGHRAWADGTPLPLLPGEPRHRLELAVEGSAETSGPGTT